MDERHSSGIKALDERISSEVKVLNESMSHLEDTLMVAINRNDTRIDDMHQSQTKWFMLLGVLVAVIPIAVVLLQGIIAK